MKIETIVKSHAGQAVKYSDGIRVQYDTNRKATVTEEVGAMLIEKYKGQIFPEGKVVVPMVRVMPEKPSAANVAVVEELRDRLQKANFLVNDYKAQLNTAKEGERVWRIKCEELMQEIASNKAVAPSEKKLERQKTPAVDESALLKEKLEAKNIKELQKIAEECKLPFAEYSKLNKTHLVEYLVEKTNG
jgi:hypothetical protein